MRFKDILVDIGEVKKGSKNNKVEWLYDELQQSDIAYYIDNKGKIQWAVVPGCSCSANFIAYGDRLVASYSPTEKDNGLVNKKPTVYFWPKDEKGNIKRIPVHTKNEKGVLVFNPELDKITVYFHATVVE